MMMNVICMVNGIRLQKPEPKFSATASGGAPMSSAAIATTATAKTANAKASGNQRSDQAQQCWAILDNMGPSFTCVLIKPLL